MRNEGRGKERRRLAALAYLALWVAMMALHQDFWLWTDRTLIGGLLPIGLAYQVGYTILATFVMAALVHWAWPAELQDLERGPVEGETER